MTIDQGPARRAQHREAVGRDAGEEFDDVVHHPDLRLVEEGPEVADDRGGQHHRQHDQRGQDVVALELAVDEPGEREADQDLEEDGPDQEMRRGGHVRPDVLIGQDALVIAQADPLDLGIRFVRGVVGERKTDGPDQRKDVDRQQQEDRGGHEDPGDGPVRQTAHLAGEGRRGGLGRNVDGVCHDPGSVGVRVPSLPPSVIGGRCMRGCPPPGWERGGCVDQSLPSSMKTSVQSSIRPSSASFAVPFPATTYSWMRAWLAWRSEA